MGEAGSMLKKAKAQAQPQNNFEKTLWACYFFFTP
jgi:hypothetical protein